MIKVKSIFNSVLIIIITVCFSSRAMALAPETHSAINKQIAQGLFLDDYLKKQLGMSDGKDTFFSDKKVFDLVAYGGEAEDAGARPFNHFLNPLTNQGLSGNYSALAWATLPVGAQPLSPFASWSDVRYYYERALTAKDKATRDNWFALTFQGVGQVMHLVQDMSVPAHVRHDIHPPPFWNDDYENWAKKNIKGATQGSGYTPYNSSFFLIPQLFDTGQYNKGTHPSITLSNSIGLAEFTNANFLSSRTIFKDFDYPDKSNLQIYPKEVSPGKWAVYYTKTVDGLGEIKHFVREKPYYDKLPSSEAFRGLMLDDKVHNDYAQFLIPRAIGYSSQVLSYFFRGKMDVQMESGQDGTINMKVKNVSDNMENMSGGEFKLYYDNSNGERIYHTTASFTSIENGKEETMTFSPPAGAASYMLVYKGKLGSETGAVIGTDGIRTCGSYSVLVVSSGGSAKSVLIWSPDETLITEEVLGFPNPCDYTNPLFAEWLAKKTEEDSAKDIGIVTNWHRMLADVPQTRIAPDGSSWPDPPYATPSDCPALTPGLIDTNVKTLTSLYVYRLDSWNWDVGVYGMGEYIDFVVEASGTDFASYIYATEPKTYSVKRLAVIGKNDEEIFGLRLQRIGHWEMYRDPNGFYSKENIVMSVIGPEGSIGDPVIQSATPDPENTLISKMSGMQNAYCPHEYFFDHKATIKGKESDTQIVNIMLMHYTLITWDQIAIPQYPYQQVSNIVPATNRSYHIYAQSLKYEDGLIIPRGRNEAYEIKIKEACELYYQLNGQPENNIQPISFTLTLVK